eukprot:gene21026-27893_t
MQVSALRCAMGVTDRMCRVASHYASSSSLLTASSSLGPSNTPPWTSSHSTTRDLTSGPQTPTDASGAPQQPQTTSGKALNNLEGLKIKLEDLDWLDSSVGGASSMGKGGRRIKVQSQIMLNVPQKGAATVFNKLIGSFLKKGKKSVAKNLVLDAMKVMQRELGLAAGASAKSTDQKADKGAAKSAAKKKSASKKA